MTYIPPSYSARYTFSGKEKDSETGYSYFGARYYSSDLSIWLSVDPMSDKYPSLSPYAYCAGNPVKLVDPNGEEVIVTGSGADEYVSQLSTENITITKDDDGKLSYSGSAVTKTEQQMVDAINSQDVTVNIYAAYTSKVKGKDAEHNGGAFLGTKFSEETGHVSTSQQVNPFTLSYIEKQIDAPRGMYARHELTESYEAGLISLNNKISSPEAGACGSVYPQAHKRASFAYDLIKTETRITIPNLPHNNSSPFSGKTITLSKYMIDPKYDTF